MLAATACFTEPSPSDDAGEDADTTTATSTGDTMAAATADDTTSADVTTSADESGPGVCGDGQLDPDEQCDDGNNDPADGCHSDCTRYRLVFVTGGMQGKLDGLDGADAMCTNDASEAGLPGPFIAWLSTPEVSAADRIGPSEIAFRRPDGILVAENLDDLLDGSIAAPIDVTAAGGTMPPGPVWTGTASGGGFAGQACAGWTSSLPSDLGALGTTTFADARWTDLGEQLCSLNARLYCFSG